MEPQRKAVKGLSQSYAEWRADLISGVDYALTFRLDKKGSDYRGTSTIFFDLKKIPHQPMTVDFRDGKILSLKVNELPIEKPTYTHLFLSVPAQALKKGQNHISIEFSHPYNTAGAGLYRFQDPEDGRVYLYSDFEPDDASLMFPCFDQPDLKATFLVSAEVPAEWKVISTAPLHQVKRISKHRTLWYFPKTERISTYVFSLHAGPYRIWKSKAGDIPLRLFARQSFAKYVKPTEWFLITQQGFQFFETYFDFKYPFHKYDQLIVPDFNSGAMENVGAVAFNEAYMPRGEWTQNQREHLAEVILHEMAHMWFGNLVTMQWWDDLWLNESFASFMATLATYEATEFKKAWQSFFDDMKQWAYWEDQLVTTHPIVGTVADTDQAFINFDGITYGKGASVLKQLAYYLGPKSFRTGVRNYFKKYKFQNTRMKNFIGELSAASNTPLSKWTDRWLKTAGVNTVCAAVTCRGGKIVGFSLKQTSEGGERSPLRPHRTQVGLYAFEEDRVVLKKKIEVAYQEGMTRVPEAVGEGCPALVYPNAEDYDYVKVKLDPETLRASQQYLSKIEDPFARMMFWQSLWDMVRDAQLPVQTYAQWVLKNLLHETDIKTATRVASRVKTALYYFPDSSQKEKEIGRQFLREIEALMWEGLKQAKPKSDFQKLWFDTYVKIAETSEAQERLVALLDHKIRFQGLTLDQDRRWSILTRLHQMAWPKARPLRKRELHRDPSEKGQKSSLSAEVSIPQISVKKRWFEEIASHASDLSLARQKAVMEYLFPREQDEFRQKLGPDFFKRLLALSPKKDNAFLSSYTMNLVPSVCTPESVKTLKAFLDHHPTLPPVVIKRLRVAHQEDERCVRIRQRASDAAQSHDYL